MEQLEMTYCEECEENFEEEKFDYRFDRPVCQDCAEQNPELEEELEQN